MTFQPPLCPESCLSAGLQCRHLLSSLFSTNINIVENFQEWSQSWDLISKLTLHSRFIFKRTGSERSRWSIVSECWSDRWMYSLINIMLWLAPLYLNRHSFRGSSSYLLMNAIFVRRVWKLKFKDQSTRSRQQSLSRPININIDHIGCNN